MVRFGSGAAEENREWECSSRKSGLPCPNDSQIREGAIQLRRHSQPDFKPPPCAVFSAFHTRDCRLPHCVPRNLRGNSHSSKLDLANRWAERLNSAKHLPSANSEPVFAANGGQPVSMRDVVSLQNANFCAITTCATRLLLLLPRFAQGWTGVDAGGNGGSVPRPQRACGEAGGRALRIASVWCVLRLYNACRIHHGKESGIGRSRGKLRR
jgi:hypothetical protein